MPKVTLPEAHCQLSISLARSGKTTEHHLTRDEVLIYWEGMVIALFSGGFIYHHIPRPSAAITKMLDAYSNLGARSRPLVALPARDFDFVVGSVLTRVGLSLTRAPQEKS